MTTYIDITLVNFKCWINETFRLLEGVNLFTGESGCGKSTVCKGIHFVLYGGRKFKKIHHRSNPNGNTEVTFDFFSPTLRYRIVRKRPSESLYMFLQDNTGVYELKDKDAQAWIDSQFGVESIWLASSFISRKQQHFLIDSSNTDKMKLLQYMAFGEEVLRNQPDTYLTPAKMLISQYTESLKACNDDIRMKQGIKSSIISRCGSDILQRNISIEEHQQLINNGMLISTELDKLRFSSRLMKTRVELEDKMNRLVKYAATIEMVDEKCKETTDKILKFELSEKLKNFDNDVLTFDRKELDKITYLYEKYVSSGWNNKSSLSEYLSIIKNELSIYEQQMKLEEKNTKIRKINSEREDLNKALRKAYLKQKSDYDLIVSDIETYYKKKEEITKKYEETIRDVYTKFSDNDNLSSIWLTAYRVGVEMSLNELICPNCNHGLILENGRLQKGTLVGGEDGCESIRKKQSEVLSLINIEYLKRVEREKVIAEYESFSKLIPRQTPDLPEEPKIYEMDQLIPVKQVTKPKLDTFEIPSIPYDKYISLKYSLQLVKFYEDLSLLSNVELVDDVSNLRSHLIELKQLRTNIEKVNLERKEIEASLTNLPQIDSNIDQNIAQMEKDLFINKQKIEVANVIREIENIDKQIKLAEDSVKNCITSLEYLEYFCSEVDNLANERLLKKVNELNGPLSVILSDLFNHPLTVELTPFKELKTGDTKRQINFDVLFKGFKLDSTDEFSDGEEGRLSLALLIAFSRINKNPFVIIDEILSSVHSEKQNDCIDIIEKWTPGKFVIHICHGISEGHHYNVRHFPPLSE